MWWFDFADGARELVSFAVDVFAVHTVAVACGQRRLDFDVYMSVFNCGLMGHLGKRKKEMASVKKHAHWGVYRLHFLKTFFNIHAKEVLVIL